MTASASSPDWVVGRYQVYEEIASGGMATVYYGRLLGPVGFSRVVAIKRLHPHLAKDPEFVAMFIDEARMAAKIRHPNVVPMLDVVANDDNLVLVMEYVQGETLARLIRMVRARDELIPAPIAASIVVGALYGLHAAHEAKGDKGEPLNLVHRDISPQNIVVGTDGVARVLDFGIAKAAGRLQETREGRLKGKIAYMAPEHIRGEAVTRAADIYAASVVLWEALAGERLFSADNDADLLEQVLDGKIGSLMSVRKRDDSDDFETMPTSLSAVVVRGLAKNPADRYASAHEMAREIERRTRVASAGEVSEWVERVAGEGLAEQARKLAEVASRTDLSAELLPSGEVKLSSRPPPPPAPATAASRPPPPPATPADLPPAPARRSRRTALWVGPLLVAAVAAAALVWRHQSAKRTAEPVASPAPSASAASSADPDEEAQIMDIESTPDNQSAAHPRTRVQRASGRPARPGIVREFPGSKSQCTPPYVIDEQGVKHYKVECL